MTTAAYIAHRFEGPLVRLTCVRDQACDTDSNGLYNTLVITADLEIIRPIWQRASYPLFATNIYLGQSQIVGHNTFARANELPMEAEVMTFCSSIASLLLPISGSITA